MTSATWYVSAIAHVVGGLLSLSLLPRSDVRAQPLGPVAQIVSPQPGTKLRAGQSLPIVMRVAHTTAPVKEWKLFLVASDGEPQEIASGRSAVDGQPVATLRGDQLLAGAGYRLRLDATDVAGGVARAETTVRVPDPQFGVIPMEPGNLSRSFFSGIFIDGAGERVIVSGSRIGEFDVLDRTSGRVQKLMIGDIGGPWQLSRDGRRFFARTDFGPTGIGVGFVDLETLRLVSVAPQANDLFTTDFSGHRAAVQLPLPTPDPVSGRLGFQYYLYDDSGTRLRQLTNDPNAIRPQVAIDDCPRSGGSKPLITADGQHVVLITSAALGVAPDDPAVGCRVFVYDVAADALRSILGLPRQTVIDVPALSDDGRWLSYTSINYAAGQPHGVFASLADLETGTVLSPIGGVTSLPSFDSVVSGDGRHVVVSAHADLDPHVGNADLTREIFVYDRIADEFHQVSETTGGVIPSSGTCDLHEPTVNRDASVIGFSFFLLSGGGCGLAGPQRSEIDGLFLGRVRAVRKRAGNRPPLFQAGMTARVRAGSEFQLQLSATDPDGDPITFFAQLVDSTDVPPGSSIEDHHNGTATLQWPTQIEQAGLYQLRVAAFDEGGGEVFHDVSIAVCNEVQDDAGEHAVITGIFSPLAGACTAADRNGDQRVTGADLVAPLPHT